MTESQLRRLTAAVGVLLLLEFVLFVDKLIPVRMEIVEANYQVGGGRLIPRGLPHGSSPIPSFLAGVFSVRIPKRAVGQRIALERVVLLTEDGKRILGTLPIRGMRRRLRAEVVPPAGPPATTEQLEEVIGKLQLYPFEGAEVSFGVGAQQDFGIEPGWRIRARIEGSSGFRKIRAETVMKSAPGFG